jgi:hypothetical protein
MQPCNTWDSWGRSKASSLLLLQQLRVGHVLTLLFLQGRLGAPQGVLLQQRQLGQTPVKLRASTCVLCWLRRSATCKSSSCSSTAAAQEWRRYGQGAVLVLAAVFLAGVAWQSTCGMTDDACGATVDEYVSGSVDDTHRGAAVAVCITPFHHHRHMQRWLTPHHLSKAHSCLAFTLA